MRKNLFIALEGIDGSGKSTQAKLLSQKLADNGHKVYATFEPTDRPIGAMIRNIMKGQMNADHRTIAALFVADRLDHLLNEENGIVKKLEEGFTVVTDRYYFSSYAYHGAHINMDWVIEANAMSAKILRPDMTVFIDVPPQTSISRLNSRRTIELYETLDNLTNVRAKYFEAFDKLKEAENIFITNGERPLDEVINDIWNEVESLFERKKKLA